jgi:hypothetical protein
MATRPVPTLAEPLGDQPLRAVRTTIESVFAQHHYRPPFVLVEQWSTADDEHLACEMPDASVVAAWVRDGDGFHPISEEERVEWHVRYPRPFDFTLVQFFIEPDGQHVVMAVVLSPRAAHGGRYRVAPGPAGPVLFGESSWQA